MKVEPLSWDRFLLRSFEVSEPLLGKSHEFNFRGKAARITLPGIELLERGPGYDVALQRTSYRMADGEIKNARYQVFFADVRILVAEGVEVPCEVFGRPCNQFDKIPQSQQHEYDRIAKEYHDIAYGAFEYWLRVIRWKTLGFDIGQPEILSNESGWSTYLHASHTGTPFWIGSARIIVEPFHTVTEEHWEEIGQATHRAEEPPIWFELVFRGQLRMKRDDLQGAIVDCAVASETLMRSALSGQLEGLVGNDILDALAELNIMQVFNRFVKKRYAKALKRELLSPLHRLFSLRNQIMHLGTVERIEAEECRNLCRSAKEFVVALDGELRTSSLAGAKS